MRSCLSASTVTCQICSTIFSPVDITSLSDIHHCGKRDYVRNKCEDCRAVKLDEAMENSDAGEMYRRVANLKFDLREKISIGLDDIDMDVYLAFQKVTREQEKYEAEKKQNK